MIERSMYILRNQSGSFSACVDGSHGWPVSLLTLWNLDDLTTWAKAWVENRNVDFAGRQHWELVEFEKKGGQE